MTADLDAMFPACWRADGRDDGVALLDCQQMRVQGDLPRRIRVLAQAQMPIEQRHHYLREPNGCVRTIQSQPTADPPAH